MNEVFIVKHQETTRVRTFFYYLGKVRHQGSV